MAVPISEIIDVKIDLTNPQIAEQDFSTPLIFSRGVTFEDVNQVVAVFGSPNELIEPSSPIRFVGRAMVASDAPYLAASKFYSTAKSKFLVGGPTSISSTFDLLTLKLKSNPTPKTYSIGIKVDASAAITVTQAWDANDLTKFFYTKLRNALRDNASLNNALNIEATETNVRLVAKDAATDFNIAANPDFTINKTEGVAGPPATADSITVAMAGAPTSKTYNLSITVGSAAAASISVQIFATDSALAFYQNLAETIKLNQTISQAVNVTSDVNGVRLTTRLASTNIDADSNADIETSKSESLDGVISSLNKIAENADFYFLMATTRDLIENCSIWAQSNNKMFFFSTDEAGSIATPNEGSPDVLKRLSSLKLTRSAGLFSRSQSSFPEAVWVGSRANDEPGSSVWAYSELTGIAADDLSTFQYKQVLSRNANAYVNIAKRDVILKGQVFSGQYIDEIISTDYLKFQIERAFFSLLLTKKKIPYTDEGITIVAESLIRVLDSAKRYILESYTLRVPAFDAISPLDRASRILKISIVGTQKGAIQQGSINLTIGFGG